MENLAKLMCLINETGRSVSWSTSNFLYEHRGGIFPKAEYSATVFYPNSCRIEVSFEAPNLDQLYEEVEDWARKERIEHEEERRLAIGETPF